MGFDLFKSRFRQKDPASEGFAREVAEWLVGLAGTGLAFSARALGVAFGTSTPGAVASAGSVGTADTVSRSDHVHGFAASFFDTLLGSTRGMRIFRGASAWLAGGPATAAGHKTANQTIADATTTDVSWVELYDYGSFFDGTTFTIAQAGRYSVKVQINWDATAGADRYVEAYINGAAARYANVNGGSSAVVVDVVSLTFDYDFAVGDTLKFRAWQNTGGNLDILFEGTGGVRGTFCSLALIEAY